jgi:hypothetical protein
MAGRGRDAETDGEAENTDNVVRFPRDWFGSLDDLVPIGPSSASSGSTQTGAPDSFHDLAADADDFWGEDAQLAHRAVHTRSRRWWHEAVGERRGYRDLTADSLDNLGEAPGRLAAPGRFGRQGVNRGLLVVAALAVVAVIAGVVPSLPSRSPSGQSRASKPGAGAAARPVVTAQAGSRALRKRNAFDGPRANMRGRQRGHAARRLVSDSHRSLSRGGAGSARRSRLRARDGTAPRGGGQRVAAALLDAPDATSVASRDPTSVSSPVRATGTTGGGLPDPATALAP